jgi:hypothetical protein
MYSQCTWAAQKNLEALLLRAKTETSNPEASHGVKNIRSINSLIGNVLKRFLTVRI